MNKQFLLNQILNNNQAMQNPIIKNAISMYQQGNTQGINELAGNIAKEKGVDINQLTQQIKSQFGIS